MEVITIEQIQEAVKKTGFIFEQTVAAAIEQVGFLVMTNVAYLDEQENKSREIDVVGHQTIFKFDAPKVSGVCYLTCECKHADNPLVFFTRKKMWGDKYYSPQEVQLPFERYFKRGQADKTITLDGFYYLELEKDFFYHQSDIRAAQFCRITRNGKNIEAQSSGVMDGLLYPLLKAYRNNSKNAPQNNEAEKFCKIFFNLVVTSGELYTLDTEKKDAVPEKQNYVPFVKHLHGNELAGNFLVTFVTYDYLSTFINEIVLPFCGRIEQKYKERPDLLLGHSLQDIG